MGAELGGQETARIPDPVAASGLGEDAGAGGTPDLAADVPDGGVLVFQRGARKGERLLLDMDRTLVGRHADADIVLEDVTVSRRHAEFLPEGDGHVVRDMGSLNGTYVNGERVDSVVLRAGDEVQIGKYRFRYQPGGAAE